MSWHLQKADESTSPQPGGSSFDEFLRRNVVMATLEDMVAWGRKNSIWPFNFGLSCCYVEMATALTPRHDMARFGNKGNTTPSGHDYYSGHGFSQNGTSGQASL